MKTKHLLSAAALAALLPFAAKASTATIVPSNDPLTVPPQAAAVGYSTLTFDDEFTTSTTVSTSGSDTSGYNWYPNFWNGASAADVSVKTGNVYAVSGNLTTTAPSNPTAAQTATGVLSIIGGGNLGSVPEYPNVSGMGKYPALQGSFQHCYYEARIQMNPHSVTSENAFWSWSTSQFYNASVSSNYIDNSEMDFFEWCNDSDDENGTMYYFYGVNTLHEWGGSTDLSNTNNQNLMDSIQGSSSSPAAIMGDGNFHVYGCLWVQLTATTGYVEYYLDNNLIVHENGVTRFLTGVGTGKSSGAVTTVNGVVCYTAPEAGLTSQEAQHMYMIIGGETGWPLNIDWVHVWQSSGGAAASSTGTTAQTVSGFNSTLSLTTAQSPYTLPATTSAGLTLSYSVTSGPATVSGNTLTLTGAGTVVVKATQAGNSTYAAYSGTETITVTVPLVAQTLSSFPSTLALETTASPYSLTSTTSAGLTVSYSVASGPASVSGHSLTLTGAGTVVLNATQAGNSTYSAFSASETITVTAPGNQALSGFPSTLALETTQSPYSLTSTTSAGLTVTYTVVSGPATVSGHTLTLTGAGTVVLNAAQAGNSSYAAFAATETITVTAATQSITGFPSTLSLTMGQSPYSLPTSTSAGLALSYSVVSGPASVSGHTLTLTGAGSVVVKATQAGNSTYAAFSANETITVAPLTAQTVSGFPSTLNLSMTQSPYALPSTTSAGLTITYVRVSGPATISGNTLTLTGAGTVVLTASQAGNSTYAAYAGQEAITVTTAPQTVTGFPSTLSLSTSQSPYSLPATTSAGLTISYSVASGPGTVSGHSLTLSGAGTVVVNATQAGNATYAAYSGTETISVSSAAAQTVASFPTTQTVTLGSGAITLPATTSAGLTILYSVVSGPATISGDTLTITGSGTVVLSATQAGNGGYAPFSATDTITVTGNGTMAFSQWEAQSGYFTSAQMSNTAISGPTATPENDGVPNLLKYLYDINPAVPMNAAALAAMPTTDVDTTTTPGTTYLTLTYRKNKEVTGVTVQVQTSPDLQTWTTVTPNITNQTGTDPNTGDPIEEVEVNTNGASSEFIRLNVTSP